MPYLIDGEKVISESDGITVYICLKGNKPELLGRNADEQVLMATCHGVWKDLRPNFSKLAYASYENEESFQKAVSEAIKSFEPYLKKLNGLLG